MATSTQLDFTAAVFDPAEEMRRELHRENKGAKNVPFTTELASFVRN